MKMHARFNKRNGGRYRGDFSGMSFKGMGKSIQTMEAPIPQDRRLCAHRLDEFPVGYSLTGCSPALPVSASPTGVDDAAGLAQVRGNLGRSQKKKNKNAY
jgi:hypothetical protein